MTEYTRVPEHATAIPTVTGTMTGRTLADHLRYEDTGGRAIIGARIAAGHIQVSDLTREQIAVLVGVSPRTMRMAAQILAHHDLVTRVALDRLSLARAVAKLKGDGNGLTRAWHHASPDERIAFGRTVGPEAVWDAAISPVIC
jgi:hypothetical protein